MTPMPAVDDVVLPSGRIVRRTQMDAYSEVRDSGRLAQLQAETYDALMLHGPITRNELDNKLAPGRPNASYSRRLSELERMGLAVRAGTRTCRVTDRVCDAWDITERRSADITKPTKKARRKQLADALRRYVADDTCQCLVGLECKRCEAERALA